MTVTLKVDSDEPVLVVILPLRKAARPTSSSSHARPTLDTTAEEPSNVVPLRKAVG